MSDKPEDGNNKIGVADFGKMPATEDVINDIMFTAAIENELMTECIKEVFNSILGEAGE